MKKKTLMALFGLTLALASLSACGSATDKKTDSSSSSSATSEQTSEVASTTASQSATVKSDDVKLDLSAAQQVGQDGFGYVYVPKDWVHFQDVNAQDVYQYSDSAGYNLVTMYRYSKEDLNFEKIDDAAVEQAAALYVSLMEQQAVFENITSEKAKISGYDSYQINGRVKSDGKLLRAWLFRTGQSERIYLISLEGDEATFNSVLPYIEATWSETK